MSLQRLKEAAEKAKKELSTTMSTNINLPFITATQAGPLHLNMDIQGCFKASQETSKEEFNKMLSINGCAALFSIARSIIVSVTSQSLVQGSILLPMVNIFNLRKEKLELEKE